MTCEELGQWMKELGAWDALNLDGGGSTTMWTQERGLLNQPSAGVERVVSNHLAVFASGEGAPSACPTEWIEKIEEIEEVPISVEEVSAEAMVERTQDDETGDSGGRCSVAGGRGSWWWVGLVALIWIAPRLRRSGEGTSRFLSDN